MTNKVVYKEYSQFLDGRYLLGLDTSDSEAMLVEYFKDSFYSRTILLSKETAWFFDEAYKEHINRINTAQLLPITKEFYAIKRDGDESRLHDTHMLPREIAQDALDKLKVQYSDNLVLQDVDPTSFIIKVSDVSNNPQNTTKSVSLRFYTADNHSHSIALNKLSAPAIRQLLKEANANTPSKIRFQNMIDEHGNAIQVLNFDSERFDITKGTVRTYVNEQLSSQIVDDYASQPLGNLPNDEHEFDDSLKDNPFRFVTRTGPVKSHDTDVDDEFINEEIDDLFSVDDLLASDHSTAVDTVDSTIKDSNEVSNEDTVEDYSENNFEDTVENNDTPVINSTDVEDQIMNKDLFSIENLSDENNIFLEFLINEDKQGSLSKERRSDTLKFLVNHGYVLGQHQLSREQNNLLRKTYVHFISALPQSDQTDDNAVDAETESSNEQTVNVETFTIDDLDNTDTRSNSFFRWLKHAHENESLNEKTIVNIGLYLKDMGFDSSKHRYSIELIEKLKSLHATYLDALHALSVTVTEDPPEGNAESVVEPEKEEKQTAVESSPANEVVSPQSTGTEEDAANADTPPAPVVFNIEKLDGLDYQDTGFYLWLKDTYDNEIDDDDKLSVIVHYYNEMGYKNKEHTYRRDQINTMKIVIMQFNQDIVNSLDNDEVSDSTEQASIAEQETELAPSPASKTPQDIPESDIEPVIEASPVSKAPQEKPQTDSIDSTSSEITGDILQRFRGASALGLFTGNFDEDVKLLLVNEHASIDLNQLSEQQVQILRGLHEEAIGVISGAPRRALELINDDFFSVSAQVNDEFQTVHFVNKESVASIIDDYKKNHSCQPRHISVIPITASTITSRVENIKETQSGRLAVSLSLHSPVTTVDLECLSLINDSFPKEVKENCHDIEGVKVFSAVGETGRSIPMIDVYCSSTDFIPHTLIRPTPNDMVHLTNKLIHLKRQNAEQVATASQPENYEPISSSDNDANVNVSDMLDDVSDLMDEHVSNDETASSNEDVTEDNEDFSIDEEDFNALDSYLDEITM